LRNLEVWGMFGNMPRKKIGVLSDAVSCSSGLGRIARDLCRGIYTHLSEEFEVCSIGYGGTGSSTIPWKEYHLHSVTNWLVPELPTIWADFVGQDEGILFSIWDLSRLYWLGMPQTCPDPNLRRWVETAKMKKWTYHAIDAEGPFGKLPHRIAETMKGFDRVLDYSAFSSRITSNPDHLPHGIDTSVFKPYPRSEMRKMFAGLGFTGLNDDTLLIGIVATNQVRKNWALGMETAKILLDRGHDVRVWAHTDVISRYWDIGQLVVDWGLADRAAVTTQRFTDEQLAQLYSACNVTFCIGPEGMGYPAMESLACGVPCIAGSYAAQAEFIPKSMQVDPIAYYYEGAFCSKRPAHDPLKWAIRTEMNMDKEAQLPSAFDWNGSTLWPAWESWFRKGIE
jgi:glycosyltransferase involved in cell wall biosynthesis